MSPISIQNIFDTLYAHYGEQHWWPAESAFEMMVGAILTQNTNWKNVEKAIHNLQQAAALQAEIIANMKHETLCQLIRPSGFFNQKAIRLQHLARFYLQHGGVNGIKALPEPRKALLDLHGIGPETADSILLYALNMPIFVIDAYSKRIFSRLGLVQENIHYDTLQAFLQQHLPSNSHLFNEFHALIVQHAKQHCRTKPLCLHCPLQHLCTYTENL